MSSRRDDLVETALRLFYANGFNATGIDRILAESGVAKMTLYKHFRSKDDLILAALELRDTQFREWLFGRMDAADAFWAALEKVLARDPARTSISGFSELGLVELTRKRTTESLAQRMGRPCPVCEGRGQVRNEATLCAEILRDLTRTSRQFEASGLLVLAHPDIVDRMVDEQAGILADLETRLGCSIRFQQEPDFGISQYDVVLV